MAPEPEDVDSADEGTVLAPEDLDIAADDSVAALDKGRYVIAPEGASLDQDALEESADSADQASTAADDDDSESAPGPNGRAIDAAAVRSWLEEDVETVSSRYGFHITATTEGAVGHQQMFSDDVGTVFDGLLMWYARQLDRETPVEDVLGILLLESNVRVRFPVRAFTAVLERHDLGPEDTISDLFEAIYDGSGVLFPPERPPADGD
jgi:hypothetical protein